MSELDLRNFYHWVELYGRVLTLYCFFFQGEISALINLARVLGGMHPLLLGTILFLNVL